jgi:hypothetical protein
MERLKHIIQINILLGAWLLAAPVVLGYASSRLQMGNDVTVGTLLILCSCWMLAAATGQVGAGLQLLGGLWLVAVPFARHYPEMSRPFSNDVIIGILSVLISTTTIWMLNSRASKTA